MAKDPQGHVQEEEHTGPRVSKCHLSNTLHNLICRKTKPAFSLWLVEHTQSLFFLADGCLLAADRLQYWQVFFNLVLAYVHPIPIPFDFLVGYELIEDMIT